LNIQDEGARVSTKKSKCGEAMKIKTWGAVSLFLGLLLATTIFTGYSQEDPQVRIRLVGTGQAARLAVADFQMQGADPKLPPLAKIFNTVLWNDMQLSGVFSLVPKSFYPAQLPSAPAEVNFEQWGSSELKVQDLAYGNVSLLEGQFVVECRLVDIGTREQIVGLRYRGQPDEPGIRAIAHKFADEIVLRIGGGRGIAQTKIAFVSDRTGTKEIWTMDYDGYGQRAFTSNKSLNLTPRWAVDNSKIAYTSYRRGRADLVIQSFFDNRILSFPSYAGTTTTPAWAPDGERICFSSSQTGDMELYISDIRGRSLRRLTTSRGVDISPVWNPKSGREIAFVSDRSGSAQIYIVDDEGANLRRLITEGGEAAEPSWSPDGGWIAFQWRKSLTGFFDVYVAEVATGKTFQLTKDGKRNEHPVWAPDGRHIAFVSDRSGTRQIYLMLADGTNQRQVSSAGRNISPAWSSFLEK
jgi:TolB protein